MPTTRLLNIRLHGEMPQERLDKFRELLGLERRGRLDDPDDAEFGYRYLRDEENEWADVSLWRTDNRNWYVVLDYMGQPPSAKLIDQCRTEILTAARELGFTVDDVSQPPH